MDADCLSLSLSLLRGGLHYTIRHCCQLYPSRGRITATVCMHFAVFSLSSPRTTALHWVTACFTRSHTECTAVNPKRREKREWENRGKGHYYYIYCRANKKQKIAQHLRARDDDRRSTSSLFYTLSFPLQVVGEVELLGRVVFLSLLFLLLGGRELMLMIPLW